MNPIRPAPKAIIVAEGKLLALKMRDGEDFWYMLPGGGVHLGETLHEALTREVREETGVEVEIGPLRFVRDYIAKNHEFAEEDPNVHQVEYMFECRIVDGAALGRGSDLDKDQVGLDWLPVASLEEFRLYPKTIRPLIGRMHAEPMRVYLGDVN